MGHLQPYRYSDRTTPQADVIPRNVTIGLSVGAWGFALAAAMWVVARTLELLWPSWYVEPTYARVVETAILATAVLCSWRPVPGSRSHVFARVAVLAWIVAMASEQWPSHGVTYRDSCGIAHEGLSDPPLLLVASSCARLLLWLSLAGILLASGRRFALPRWSPVVAAGFAATLAEPGLDEVLRARGTSSELFRFPTFTLSLTELAMLVVFGAAFASAAFAVRRRPLLDQDALLSTSPPRETPSETEARAFDHWSASSSALAVCTFALANLAGRELAAVPSVGGSASIGRIAFTLSVVVLLVLVERARRRHRDRSSFAPTVAASFSALCAAGSVLTRSGISMVLLHELAVGTTAFAVGGIALLLPDIPGLERSVVKVKGALYLGALFMGLSAGVKLANAASRRVAVEATDSWNSGQALLLFSALTFVTLAIHLVRPIEREALIARALGERRMRARD